MAYGEYESQQALAEHLPDNVAVPLSYGTFQLDASKSFFLTPFLKFEDSFPDPMQLTKILEKLHRSSTSPTGKYGFHVQTFNGVVPLINDWCDTWEEWFSRQFRSDIAWEQSIAGPDPEFDRVADEFFEKVIPRLLRPLETGVEFHMMREPRYQFSEKHIQAYRNVVGASDPVADFDDRNILYAMRDNIINAGLHEGRRYLRKKVQNEMLRPISKYPDGFEGFKVPALEVDPRAFDSK
ncbi:uncharacterized protein DNG_04249 [Cephalotrichum gorgonifer]|uniref:protein-ribulosamine 3-kinase n=1 Tax=Cephalotrichum gorgonifer TaxID=2041049 RepID=A0AAE8SUZ8_9PEZI|nr:uncharacterized protein DNG_04249 [Cephalotrichum gorgonifer]